MKQCGLTFATDLQHSSMFGLRASKQEIDHNDYLDPAIVTLHIAVIPCMIPSTT